MRYFPTFFDLQDKPVLLVGGGTAAARKLRLLLKAGAKVTVVAPEVTAEIAVLARGTVVWQARPFRASDLAGKALAIAASGVEVVERAVSEAALAQGLPVNVVDRPALSSFITPAIVERDPLVIGISSGGTSPVLARRLRAQIEALLPAGLGRLARFAGSFRGAVAANIHGHGARRRFWERVFDGPIAQHLLAGKEAKACEAMLALVNGPAGRNRGNDRGQVRIVGAGPGDPDLLTLKALRALQWADVIFHDNLIGPEVLDLARRDAELVHVGKSKGHHAKTQAEINALIAGAALAGRRVVRLKGGDPFVFGRGGEELDYLRARGIRAEVVPGVTAAAGCAAAAGIPLTHRGIAQAVTFVTGHAAKGAPELDWVALADPRHSLAIYMGVSTAGSIARHLIDAGAEPERPVAVVENGTRADQKIAIGRLGDLEKLLQDHDIAGPAVILVGAVVRLAETEELAPPLCAAAG